MSWRVGTTRPLESAVELAGGGRAWARWAMEMRCCRSSSPIKDAGSGRGTARAKVTAFLQLRESACCSSRSAAATIASEETRPQASECDGRGSDAQFRSLPAGCFLRVVSCEREKEVQAFPPPAAPSARACWGPRTCQGALDDLAVVQMCKRNAPSRIQRGCLMNCFARPDDPSVSGRGRYGDGHGRCRNAKTRPFISGARSSANSPASVMMRRVD